MINRNFSRLKSISLVFIVAFSVVGTLSARATAQNKSIYTKKKHQITFEAPQGTKPKQTVGGASRGEYCPHSATEQDLPLTPLLPVNSRSLTVESHPTMLVYVPETSANTALLSVRDADEDYDYQAMVEIGDGAGIVSVSLPNDAPALEIDREYQWSLILLCDNKLRPDSPVVQGDVMRVATDSYLADKLARADLLESAVLYASEGVWYDTVHSMAQLKTANPKDLTIDSSWQGLLESVGLGDVAKAKLVE